MAENEIAQAFGSLPAVGSGLGMLDASTLMIGEVDQGGSTPRISVSLIEIGSDGTLTIPARDDNLYYSIDSYDPTNGTHSYDAVHFRRAIRTPAGNALVIADITYNESNDGSNVVVTVGMMVYKDRGVAAGQLVNPPVALASQTFAANVSTGSPTIPDFYVGGSPEIVAAADGSHPANVNVTFATEGVDPSVYNSQDGYWLTSYATPNDDSTASKSLVLPSSAVYSIYDIASTANIAALSNVLKIGTELVWLYATADNTLRLGRFDLNSNQIGSESVLIATDANSYLSWNPGTGVARLGMTISRHDFQTYPGYFHVTRVVAPSGTPSAYSVQVARVDYVTGNSSVTVGDWLTIGTEQIVNDS